MSDDYEKKSWKELDSMRDRGGQKTPKKVSKKEQFVQKRVSAAARKELDKLFSGGKLSKEKSKHLEMIKELRGKPQYYEEMTKYFEKYGAPLEWDVQMLFVDHRDSKIVIAVLNEMIRTAPRENLDRQKTLAAKLRVMVLSTFDPDISDKIQELQKAIIA